MTKIFFDLEVYKNWWCAVFKTENGDWEEVINDKYHLISYLTDHEKDLLVGYNNKDFDNVCLRLIIDGRNPYEVVESWDKTKEERKIILQNWRNIPYLDIDTLDLIEDISDKENEDKELHITLKEIGLNLGLDCVEMDEFEPEVNLDDKERLAEIVRYCRHDVDITEAFFHAREKTDKYFTVKEKLIKEIGGKFSWTVAYNFGKFLKKQNIIKPELFSYKTDFDLVMNLERYSYVMNTIESWELDEKAKPELETKIHDLDVTIKSGGAHGSKSQTILETNSEWVILDIDATSYYPSIMIEWNLYSRAMESSKQIKEWMIERVKAKKAHDTVWATTLKLIINKIFGVMGSMYNPLYDWTRCREVCYTGELLILSCIEAIERLPYIKFTLLQVNTDGFTIWCKREDVDKIKEICKEHTSWSHINWECLTLEGKWFMRDVNCYFLNVEKCPEDETKIGFKNKGAPVSNLQPSWKKCWHCISQQALVNKLLGKKEIHETILECKDPRMFAITLRPKTKGFDVYYGEQKVQRTNRIFVVTDENLPAVKKYKNGVLGKFAEVGEHHLIYNGDMEGFELPENIDYSYYIDIATKNYKTFFEGKSKKKK